jgi:formate dehydrogenase subunit gamma
MHAFPHPRRPRRSRPPSRLRTIGQVLLVLLGLMLWPGAAAAGVPHEQAVPAYAEEQTILQLEQGQAQPGLAQRESGIRHLDRHTLQPPGLQGEYGVILQRGGNTWRTWRNGPLAVAAAAAMLLALAVLAIYHWRRPPRPSDAGPRDEAADGRPLIRFDRMQRWVHWVAAIAFVALALSGLILAFGKVLLLPWMGHTVFAALALGSKWLHNIAGPLFVIASLVMFVVYLRHNHFQRADWAWLRQLGGLRGGGHPPAPYFNAGEKLWFWIGVTALGLLMAASGLMLNFPYLGEVGAVSALTRYQLQWAQVVHLIAAAAYIALGLGHVYLGTLGSPEAWRAMAHGPVDPAWAREHHRLWYDEVRR